MIGALAIHDHDPVFAGGVPKHFGVAFRLFHEGVAGVARPGSSVVKTVAEALAAVIEPRPKRDHRGVLRGFGET